MTNKNVVLSIAAKVSEYATKKACGATSVLGCYQPEEPAMLKKASQE